MPAPKKTNGILSKSMPSPLKTKKPTAKPQTAYQKSMTAGISYASAKNQIRVLEKELAYMKKYSDRDLNTEYSQKKSITNAKSDASKSKRNAENAAAKVKPKPNKNVSFTYKSDKRG